VGLALLVVLDRLTPAERIAFVLHDMFDAPFAEIAGIVGRSPGAAKKLASRARTRVRGGTVDHADLTRRWEIVEAFMAAAREGVGAHGIRLWRRSYEGPRARWMSYVDFGS